MKVIMVIISPQINWLRIWFDVYSYIKAPCEGCVGLDLRDVNFY